MLPRIESSDGRRGFRWVSPAGEPMSLAEVITLPGAEPDRWLPTHLEAFDEVLIEVAADFGQVMGGGRGPARGEHEQVAAAYAAIDAATADYHLAVSAPAASDLPVDLRAGQIIGTGALMSIRLRTALGLVAAAPLDGELDQPPLGPVGGTCDLTWVDADRPALGARWVVTTTAGARLPATLSMMLFDSSGVNKDASLDEHRDALAKVTEAAAEAPDPMVTSGALDWLLFDWVMAHRESSDSGAVEVTRTDDSQMIVAAAAASVGLRRHFDPRLN